MLPTGFLSLGVPFISVPRPSHNPRERVGLWGALRSQGIFPVGKLSRNTYRSSGTASSVRLRTRESYPPSVTPRFPPSFRHTHPPLPIQFKFLFFIQLLPSRFPQSVRPILTDFLGYSLRGFRGRWIWLWSQNCPRNTTKITFYCLFLPRRKLITVHYSMASVLHAIYFSWVGREWEGEGSYNCILSKWGCLPV